MVERRAPRAFRDTEIKRLKAFMASPAYGERAALRVLAAEMRRCPIVLHAKLQALRGRSVALPEWLRHNHPGVMIDDFGLTYAEIIREMHAGAR